MGRAMARLLLIEDDDETAGEFADLRCRGHEVVRVLVGPDGFGTACLGGWDVLLVGCVPPGRNGPEAMEALCRGDGRAPVLAGGVEKRARGLRTGDGDHLAELAARIEALLRRRADARETSLRVGSLELDLIEGTARCGGRPLHLRPREFKLLKYMAQRAGQTVTRAALFREVWNYRFSPQSNLVDVHMGRLRRKLGDPDGRPIIRNVRGVGFVLDAAP